MKNLRKPIATLLAVALCTSMVSPAFAKDYNAEDGTVHVDGNTSWQDENDKYDHVENNDYEVNISGTTDQTVVEVTDKDSDLDINLDNVDANVTEGPAVDIQGGNVDIKDSNLSTKDEDHAAVEIGGNADVTISGDTTINGSGTGVDMKDDSSLTVENDATLEVNGNKTDLTESGTIEGGNTGIDMKDNSSLTVEDGGKLEANGSSVNVNVTNDKDAEVEVGGNNTGIKAEDNSQITVKGDAEVTGSVITSGSQNQAVVTVDQEGNTGLDMSGDSHATVDGGELNVADTQAGLNGYYTTQEQTGWTTVSQYAKVTVDIRVKKGNEYTSLADMCAEGKIYTNVYVAPKWVYIAQTDINALTSKTLSTLYVDNGNGGYTKLTSDKSLSFDKPKYGSVRHTLDHEFESTGTGIALNDSSTLEVDNGATLAVYGEKNAIELTGDTTIKIGENGLLRILGGPVSMGEDSSLVSAGIIIADDINAFTKGDLTGRGSIDFQGTGLHFLTCIPPKNIYDGSPYEVYVYWDVGEDFADTKLDIHFTQLMQQAQKLVGMCFPKVIPSERMNYHIVISNNSSHSLAYDADSLDINRFTTDELIEMGSKYWPSRSDNLALRALYNPQYDPTTSIGKDNLQYNCKRLTLDQLVNVEEKLAEQGYASLADYYVSFVNKLEGTEYKTLDEIPTAQLKNIFASDGNYISPVTEISAAKYEELLKKAQESGNFAVDVVTELSDGSKRVQLKEIGTIREVGLNYFYRECLQFGYGDGADGYLGVGDYQDEETKAQAEMLLALKLAALAAKGDPDGKDSVTIDAYYGISGSMTGNAFQTIQASWWKNLTLSRTDSDPVDPDPVDPDPTPDPDPDPVDPDPTPDPDPDPVDPDPDPIDPDPTPVVPDPDVPLVEEPNVEIPEPDVPLVEEPDVEIPEEEVPLAEEPVVEIPEEDVPLADVPKTGDISSLWYLTALLSACGLALLGLRKKDNI